MIQQIIDPLTDKVIGFQKAFPPTTSGLLEEVQEIAKQLQEDRKYTNLQGGFLICKDCNMIIKGQADAVEHARLTRHINFGEV
jgi:ubiquitin thioesterase OTU1